MSKLPDWPEKPDPTKWANSAIAQLGYQAALETYYESRLRVAVEALTVTHHNSPESVAGKRAGKALAAIGPLPDKGDVS